MGKATEVRGQGSGKPHPNLLLQEKELNGMILEKQNLVWIGMDAAEMAVPVEKINLRNNIVEFGTDNLFPEVLVKAYNTSPIHSAITRQKARAIAGDRLVYNEKEVKAGATKRINKFIENPNEDDDDLYDLLEKLSIDSEICGAFAIEVIWSNDGKTITEVNHIDVSNLRFLPKVGGKISGFWYSEEWVNYRKPDFQASYLPVFNPENAKKDKRQVMYISDYLTGHSYYGLPCWHSAINYIDLDGELGTHYLSSVKNGMNPSLHISMVNGIPSLEEQDTINLKLKRKYQGAGKSGSAIITYSESPDTAPVFKPLDMNKNVDKVYLLFNDVIIQNILSVHGVTSPMLFGVAIPGKLGGGNEMQIAWELFTKQVIQPSRKKLLKALNKILFYVANDANAKFSIESNPLIATQFSEKILAAIMSVDELRGQIGLAPMVNGTPAIGNKTPDEEIGRVV